MAEEKDHYIKERDHFRNVALRHRLPIAPRPPSPKRRRHATLGEASIARYQEVEGSGPSGRQTRRRTSTCVLPQGPSPSTLEPPPRMLPFERMSAVPSEFIQGGNRQILIAYQETKCIHV